MLQRQLSSANQAVLKQQIAKQLKVEYQTMIKRGKDSEWAFNSIYEQAVTLIANSTNISQDKIRFKERELLQEIMKDITS